MLCIVWNFYCKRWLHGRNWFKRSIFEFSITQGLSKITTVSMARKLVDVPLHLFLTGLITKSFCQIIKSPNISAEAFDDSSNNFLWWYPNFREYNGGNTYDTRPCDCPPAALRLWDKFLEMNFETKSGDKVPGYYCELKSNNFFFTFIKGEKKNNNNK